MAEPGGPPTSKTPSSKRAGLGLAVTVGAALLAGIWLAFDTGPTRSTRLALSPQECTTECQSRQTDCILDCDGAVACERRCTQVGKACVGRCRQPPDAGAAGAGGSGGKGGAAGRRGAG